VSHVIEGKRVICGEEKLGVRARERAERRKKGWMWRRKSVANRLKVVYDE